MRYNSACDSIEMTVEELCFEVFGSRDIDNRRGASPCQEKPSERRKIYDRLHLLFGMRYYDRVELTLSRESVVAAVDKSSVSSRADLVVLLWRVGNTLTELTVYVYKMLFK